MIQKVKQPEISDQLVEQLIAQIDPSEILTKDGLFAQLKKKIVEKIMQSELDHELGYNKHSKTEKKTDNRRNGSYNKTIIDSNGKKLDIEVPRDREGEYEPQIIPKGIRRVDGFDEQVISLYARGLTVGEIQGHLKEIYHTKISKDLNSTITDGVLEEVIAWQNRSLDSVYPIMYLDCIHVKGRDNNIVINKAVYLAIGVNMDGKKRTIGYLGRKSRGIKVLVASSY